MTTASADDIVFGYAGGTQSSFHTDFVERMRIDNGTGYVGIGTTSPGKPLDVVGGASIDGSTLVVDSTNHRIGIGTTSPSQKITAAHNSDNLSVNVETYSTSTSHRSILSLLKSNSDTLGALNATRQYDYLGAVEFYGVNSGNTIQHGAAIRAIQDANSGSYVPARLEFMTSSASSGPSTALTIHSSKDVAIGDGTWNGGHLMLGNYHLWVDTSGRLRIKNGSPSSATDGTVVGAQTA